MAPGYRHWCGGFALSEPSAQASDMGSDFENLTVWHRSRALFRSVHKATDGAPFERDWDMRSQMRRAALSILSNIAEGSERKSDNESTHFLYIAKGSSGELRAQLIACLDIRYLGEAEAQAMIDQCAEVSRMLAGLIDSRKAREPSSQDPGD